MGSETGQVIEAPCNSGVSGCPACATTPNLSGFFLIFVCNKKGTSMQNITKALLSLLNKGIVNFTYRKVDGSIRTAVGTRNLCFACQALGISIPMPKTGRNNPTAY